MPAKEISIERAKPEKLFYFVANCVVVRKEDASCLLLQRSKTEKVHPGKWAMPGGKLEWKDLDINNPTRMNDDVIDFEDALEDLLRREVKEEAGIDIGDDIRYINSVAYIRTDGVPTILLKFAVEYAGGKVVLEEGAFDNFAWVKLGEVSDYDIIEGIDQEMESALTQFGLA